MKTFTKFYILIACIMFGYVINYDNIHGNLSKTPVDCITSSIALSIIWPVTMGVELANIVYGNGITTIIHIK